MIPKPNTKQFFAEGGGRPYEPRPYEGPKKAEVDRHKKLEIDMADLNKPGIGPVHFTKFPQNL